MTSDCKLLRQHSYKSKQHPPCRCVPQCFRSILQLPLTLTMCSCFHVGFLQRHRFHTSQHITARTSSAGTALLPPFTPTLISCRLLSHVDLQPHLIFKDESGMLVSWGLPIVKRCSGSLMLATSFVCHKCFCIKSLDLYM